MGTHHRLASRMLRWLISILLSLEMFKQNLVLGEITAILETARDREREHGFP